ncbi:MAG TPA: 50S ribosomal protein L11 methyltransferase [Solirubrobacteraceae bacterium]|nr:50S ribosomal protein L11 methyltransferase [Solirubrobacteraceae bacterium]
MIRLALRVARADSELVLADLLELAPDGVEELELDSEDGAEPQVEYAVYGPPGELPRLPDLQVLAGGVAVQVSSSEVPDDWPERWKRFHRPVLIEASTASLHVRPPWEPPSANAETIEIVIDPAQAFGTGAHATTRLCLELLLELVGEDPSRGPVLDVGAGSGVLAIAAAELGYGPVLALDNDPLSVQAIEDNARVADVELAVRLFDLRSQRLPLSELGRAGEGVVLANLLRPLLLELAAALAEPPAHLIASGLLREEADEVARAFARRGLAERGRRERGDWAALWLSRG